ncbi:MAG: sigma-70 family RNA polymerase sigma factor [Candidatus Eisenbacteria bacterium]|uniref:Sigma-70 family RNA polymerase sigma factor n=1 Tax=Eiseniibacteriota bacterium TaxID=2212470 RepID=A0A849SU67_UNCEI|nr:sigma-70 family RNA polymerase sigma factor [Candidatus Eisenbacteria bacterium]
MSELKPPSAAELQALPDSELVQHAQQGETRAFDELVRRYQDRVYRLTAKILRNDEDAAEALQDAFLSAFKGLKNFKAESTFSTWLYRIATNAALMKIRRRREGHVSYEQSQSREEGAEPLAIADWSAQPLEELLDSETRAVMQEGVDQLSPELRTVFVMRDVEGLSNTEVAEALELTVPAVKSRLHRARIHLRDRLHRYFADKLHRRAPRPS